MKSLLCFASVFLIYIVNIQAENVTVTTNTGFWAIDMSWELTDNSGNTIASFNGVEDFSTTTNILSLDPGCYAFIAYDAWEDGWAGGNIEISHETFSQTFELNAGGIGYFTFEVYSTPCDWSFPGCTNSLDINYVIGATVDDGSCSGSSYNYYYHDGLNRSYLLHIPPNLEPNAPLVFVLHGGTESASSVKNYCEMDAIADEEGFVVCYPQSTLFDGVTFWDANLNLPWDIDDSGFLGSLASFLQQEYTLNPSCTYACGFSTGAYMSYVLACEQSSVFKGIGSLAGSMPGSDWQNCTPNPIPLIQISGMQDEYVPYTGVLPSDTIFYGSPAINDLINFWTEDVNNCTTSVIDSVITENVVADFYSNCSGNAVVWDYRVLNGTHAWYGVWGNTEVHASHLFWDFFKTLCSQDIGIDDTDNHSIQNTEAELIRIVDVLGREEVPNKLNTLLFYMYSDGRVEKKIIMN